MAAEDVALDLDALAETARTRVTDWLATVGDRVASIEFVYQTVAIAAALALGWFIARRAKVELKRLAEARKRDFLARLYGTLSTVAWPAAAVVLLWILTAVFGALELPNTALRVVASLLNAWIIIRVVSSTVASAFWARVIAVTAWTIAALYILRLLGPVVDALDAAAIDVGEYRLSLLRAIVGVTVASVALWAGGLASNVIHTQLRGSKTLPPAMSGLLSQFIRVAFVVLAFVVALYTVGVNLTALAVFTGALGVGIGFGLQAIFSNFVSGVIILFEESLKVGDFVELQSGVTGEVKEINIRSTLITTNDNIDILVPNEEFIKGQVINWTLRDTYRRLKVPFGVAYGTDKDLVKKAGLEAAAEVEFTEKAPGREPDVWLVGFGDSSLDFELVVWIGEGAVKRPAKVNAAYCWAIESALKRHGIEIPFPQRDVHIIPPAGIDVRLATSDADDDT